RAALRALGGAICGVRQRIWRPYLAADRTARQRRSRLESSAALRTDVVVAAARRAAVEDLGRPALRARDCQFAGLDQLLNPDQALRSIGERRIDHDLRLGFEVGQEFLAG